MLSGTVRLPDLFEPASSCHRRSAAYPGGRSAILEARPSLASGLVAKGMNFSGTSRQGVPVRNRHRIPFIMLQ